ncbi:MAG: cytochrome b N-terminal domain-containing protein, partial [Devosia sp.]
MSEHSTYTPGTGIEKWLDERLPIIRFSKEHLMDFPTPKNLNYWWTFGAILAIMLVVQIVTGVILAMHYTPNIGLAFDSVEHIRRDVNGGRIIQATHAVGASMFFAAVYIHIFRGLYFGSYKAPREILWILGVLIFVLMMATAFMG